MRVLIAVREYSLLKADERSDARSIRFSSLYLIFSLPPYNKGKDVFTGEDVPVHIDRESQLAWHDARRTIVELRLNLGNS